MPGIVVYRTPRISLIEAFFQQFGSNQRDTGRLTGGVEQLNYRNAIRGLGLPDELNPDDFSRISVNEVRNINDQLTTQVDPTIAGVASGIVVRTGGLLLMPASAGTRYVGHNRGGQEVAGIGVIINESAIAVICAWLEEFPLLPCRQVIASPTGGG